MDISRPVPANRTEKRKFEKSWRSIDDINKWILVDEQNLYFATCCACNVNLQSGSVKKYVESVTHKKMLN